MELGVDLAEPAQFDPRVDLGRGDRGVAEHLLDDAEVGAARRADAWRSYAGGCAG